MAGPLEIDDRICQIFSNLRSAGNQDGLYLQVASFDIAHGVGDALLGPEKLFAELFVGCPQPRHSKEELVRVFRHGTE